MHIYSTVCEIGSWWEAAVQHRELGSMVCGDPGGWDVVWGVVRRRLKREGIYDTQS